MKPIKLSLMGFNSFLEKEEIDFEMLTKYGMFGIFGPTGSGKSTILDGICFALYGKVPRLGYKSNSEIVNINSKTASVSFTFLINAKSGKKIYTVERSKIKDNNGKVKDKMSRILLIEEDNITVLEEGSNNVSEKVEEILGLKYDDFIRSIVIPQGKFSEFLKLTPTDRSKMLERIFGLDEYGEKLQNKVKEKNNYYKAKINEENAKLSPYEDISIYENEKKEIIKIVKQNEKNIKNISSDIELMQEKIKELNEIKELENSFLKLKNELENIQNKEKRIEELKETISFYKKSAEVISLIKEEKNILLKEKETFERSENSNNLLIKKEKKYNEYMLSLEEYEKKYKIDRIDLKEKYENLNLIFELEKKLKNEKDEKIKIEYQKENIDKIIKTLNDENEKIQNELYLYKQKIEKLNKEKNNYKVSEKYREAITSITSKEENIERNDYIIKEILEEIQNIDEKISKSKNKNKEDKKKIEEILSKKQELNEEIENIKIYDTNLMMQEILKLKNEIENFEMKFNEKKENETLLTSKNKNLNEIQESVQILYSEIKILEENLKEIKDEIEIKRNKNKINEIKKILIEGEKCVVCGSIVKNIENENINDDYKIVIEELEIKMGKLLLQYNKKERDKNEIELVKNNLEFEIKTLKDNIKRYENFNEENLRKMKNSLEEKINEKETVEKKIEKNAKKLEDNTKKIKEIEIEIAKYESSIQNEIAKIEEIEKDKINKQNKIDENKKNIKKLKDEIEFIAKENKISNLFKEKENMKISIEKYSFIEEEILNETRKLSVLEENFKEIIIKKHEEEIKEKENLIYLNETNIKIKELLEKNEKIREKLDKETIENFEKDDSYIKQIEEKIVFIEKEYNRLSEIKDTENKEYNVQKKEVEMLEESYKELYKQRIEKTNKIDEIILNKNLIDRENIINIFNLVSSSDDIEKEIKDFENEKFKILSDIKQINHSLKNRNFEERELIKIENSLKEMKEEFEKIKKYNISSDEKLKNIEEKMEIIKKSKELLDIYLKENKIYEDMADLFKANGFTTFIAANELKYVCYEASKRLKDITKNRFALEIDEAYNFIMRDDISGGIKRKIDTLSGGETFLVSLSLALALSNQIQLKGSSILECFFLDEGFGSLDTELLDTVINSLEKIRNNKFSIGIITHVEELKKRLPIRLNVIPQSEKNGSSVNIELS